MLVERWGRAGKRVQAPQERGFASKNPKKLVPLRHEKEKGAFG